MTIAAIVAAHGALRAGARGEDVRALQAALVAAGHQLVLDADYGDITRRAVQRFQAAAGLNPDGVVGPATAAALDRPPSREAEPALPSALAVAPWLSTARALTGTAEIHGARSNPLILSWVGEIVAKYPDLKGSVGWYSTDETAWCGLFAAYCVVSADFRPPALPLGAKNWFTDWRDGARLSEPSLGAVLVKSRLGGGHVTFYEGEDETHYFCRGGNQSDRVNVAKIAKNSDVLGFMWPKGFAIPTTGRVKTSFSGAVAGSEA